MQFSKLKWKASKNALNPEACLYEKSYFKRLFKSLLALSDSRLSSLNGVWCETFIVLLGEQSDMPWLPGVQYFCRHENAPNIYMPTQLECSLKYDVIQKIVMKEFEEGSFLLEPERKIIVPLITARTLDRAFITKINS